MFGRIRRHNNVVAQFSADLDRDLDSSSLASAGSCFGQGGQKLK